jgi:hypothetical protein
LDKYTNTNFIMKKIITFLTLVLFTGAIFGQQTLKTNLVIQKNAPTIFLKGAGGIIDFLNGSAHITLTQSLNQLTLAGANLSLGTNNLLLTGSIGATGARVTKLWSTDAEFSNTPTIGGVLLSSLYATASSVSAITATSLGLGNVTNLSAATLFTNTPLTGIPTAPTAGLGTNTTQVATTAFVLANGGGGGGGGTWGTIAGTLTNQTDLTSALALKANLASPTFTGTVVLPSTTSIGTVSATELGYVDNVTSAIQTQFTNVTNSIAAKSNSASPTFTGTVVLPSTTSIGNVSNTEIGYVDGVTSAIQTQLTNLGSADALKANLASPTFTGTVVLPSTTSIGTVSATEIGYVDGATSNLQGQLNNTDDIANVSLLKHPTVTAKTDSYTLQLIDDGTIITMNKASATDITIPLNSSVLFPIGTQITICSIGVGQTTVVATGGVTLISKGGKILVSIYGDATLIKLATNTWKLIGSLE